MNSEAPPDEFIEEDAETAEAPQVVEEPKVRLIFGIQPVREAIRTNGKALTVKILNGKFPQLEAIARFATDQGARVMRVDRAILDKTARGGLHQGVMAEAPPLVLHPFEPASFGERALVVALDEIEDPQNFGAIIRSSVAMGASCIVWPEYHSAPLSPATFRASAGAVEHAVLCRVPRLQDAIESAKGAGYGIVGLDMNGQTELGNVELLSRVMLVIGAEGKGLRKPTKQSCTTLARLPMPGPLGSLNASVSAALALYEVLRQRR